MTHERWTQIEQLYHRALDVEKNQRAAFLREECAGDSELEQEVERLLAEEDGVANFLEKPALEETARDLASNPAQSWIGHFTHHRQRSGHRGKTRAEHFLKPAAPEKVTNFSLSAYRFLRT